MQKKEVGVILSIISFLLVAPIILTSIKLAVALPFVGFSGPTQANRLLLSALIFAPIFFIAIALFVQMRRFASDKETYSAYILILLWGVTIAFYFVPIPEFANDSPPFDKKNIQHNLFDVVYTNITGNPTQDVVESREYERQSMQEGIRDGTVIQILP